MASGSGWRGSYNKSAKNRRSRYAKLRKVTRAKGTVNKSKTYTRTYDLPF